MTFFSRATIFFSSDESLHWENTSPVDKNIIEYGLAVRTTYLPGLRPGSSQLSDQQSHTGTCSDSSRDNASASPVVLERVDTSVNENQVGVEADR